MGKKRRAYGDGSIICKEKSLEKLKKEISQVPGLDCVDFTPLGSNSQVYTNGDRPYSIKVYADGVEASKIRDLRTGLKRRNVRSHFPFTYRRE